MPVMRCPRTELNLAVSLLNGQSFRWEKILKMDRGSPDEVFIGVAKHRVWKLRRLSDMEIEYSVLARFSKAVGDDALCLRNYFQLDTSLADLYDHWGKCDKQFARSVLSNGVLLEGIRTLDQNPTETLFSFICSSNNNITRISRMVNRLCEFYGEAVSLNVDNEQSIFYDFADLQKMANDKSMEEKLKANGFGYRARYLSQTAKTLVEFGGESWLNELRSNDYETVKKKLLSLPGVGPKVADCICLMSLRKSDVVPVDTHVLQVTAGLYMPELRDVKSPNLFHHTVIGNFWRTKFGTYAGWGQTVLFSAQIKRFDAKSSVEPKRNMKSKRRRIMTESTNTDCKKQHKVGNRNSEKTVPSKPEERC
ncbi:hypothetical protein AB6A40_010423 [Gnathostoma spinigerum]|uniref:DNA-(apurinic or apyrimidinic site) lyase n=1 Tax=Gnathostoma spinigerum TaxID=75299 RepID=A0ABD6EUR6_9BILA